MQTKSETFIKTVLILSLSLIILDYRKGVLFCMFTSFHTLKNNGTDELSKYFTKYSLLGKDNI